MLLALILSLAADPTAHRDIPYTESKHPKQTLDLYTPAAVGTARPVLVWVHGGGWQAGDKTEVHLKPQTLTDRGWLLVSINYRLLDDKVTIDQMAGDVARAMRWVRDHAKEHGGDPDRLVLAGHSAGAQLAALVCIDHRYLNAAGVPITAVKGCVPVDGDTYDVPVQIATVEQRRKDIYRAKFGDVTKQRELSPITHVAAGKGIPPILILHVAGHPETGGQSERLVKALTAAGMSARAYAAAGKTHTTINSELGAAGDPATAEYFAFLDRVVK